MSMHELAELPDGSVGHGGSIYDNDPAGDDGKEMTLVSLEDLEIAQRKRQRALFRRTVAFAILSVLVGICVGYMIVGVSSAVAASRAAERAAHSNCTMFDVPSNATAHCPDVNGKSCGECLQFWASADGRTGLADESERRCPKDCICIATCDKLGMDAQLNSRGGSGLYAQTCVSGDWSDAYTDADSACVDLDECISAPCQNGATCSALGSVQLNTFHCTCPLGTSGEQCETIEEQCEEQTCANGGVCREYPENNIGALTGTQIPPGTHVCDCRFTVNHMTGHRWFGEECTEATSVCTEDQPCRNGGVCTDVALSTGFSCECAGGWTGPTCNTAERPTANLPTTTITTPLGSQGDSAEENNQNGQVDLSSEDLNVMMDDHAGSVQQTIGLRFDNISLDRGAFLTEAYITFKVKAVTDRSKLDVQVLIQPEDNIDPLPFENHHQDISARLYVSTGQARPKSVIWEPDPDHNVGDLSRTIDISSIITTHKNPAWQRGNAMLFILTLYGPAGSSIRDIGTRSYESFSADGYPSFTYTMLDNQPGHDLSHLTEPPKVCSPAGLSLANGVAFDSSQCAFNGSTLASGVDIHPGAKCRVQCCDGYRAKGEIDYACTTATTWEDENGNPPSLSCLVMNQCDSSPCAHGGSCTEPDAVAGTADGGCSDTPVFTCECVLGWEGHSCESNHDDCKDAHGTPVCHHHADCTDGLNAFTCDCPPGYDGTTCEHDIDECLSAPCQNGGLCHDSNSNDFNIPPDAFRCMCVGAFTGDTCAHMTHDCSSNPCQNGGVCTESSPDYACTCLPGFANGGDHSCEQNIDECKSQPCQHGDCVDDNIQPTMQPDTFACQCLAGWNGELCDTEEDLCESNPCQNGATCTGTTAADGSHTYSCACTDGWGGEHCEAESLCNGDHSPGALCQNGGTCIDDTSPDKYHCECGDTGFSGQSCETNTDDCDDNACRNGIKPDASATESDLDPGGTCVDGINKYTCTCHPGFTGEHCTQHRSVCGEQKPCQNGGTCHDSAAERSGYTCTCPTWTGGHDCESGTDLCASSPCNNGGTCTQTAEAYTCACAVGYAGTACDVCPAGKQPNGDRTACQNCPPGRFSSDADGGTHDDGTCVLCVDGKEPAQDRQSCVACPDGKAATQLGKGLCSKCAAGQMPARAECAPAPPDSQARKLL